MTEPTTEQLAELGRITLQMWDISPEWWEMHFPIPIVWYITQIRGVPEHAR